MTTGRDQRPGFPAECRRIVGDTLAPLGFVAAAPAADSVRFDRSGPAKGDVRSVEMAWDPYDVRLTVTVDGVDLARALFAAGMPSAALEGGDPPLAEVARAVVALLAAPGLRDAMARTGAALTTLREGSEAGLIGLLGGAVDRRLRERAAARIGDLPEPSAEAVEALAADCDPGWQCVLGTLDGSDAKCLPPVCDCPDSGGHNVSCVLDTDLCFIDRTCSVASCDATYGPDNPTPEADGTCCAPGNPCGLTGSEICSCPPSCDWWTPTDCNCPPSENCPAAGGVPTCPEAYTCSLKPTHLFGERCLATP